MTTRTPWTDSENAACVALYFAMLDCATSGKPYNKAAMIRARQDSNHSSDGLPPRGPTMCNCAPLRSRSRGSIEAKLMNCTAAHAALDPHTVTMDGYGYRALSNYQASLKAAMRDALDARKRKGAA